ncbi:MAG: tetratricopeptide repeat protein [Calditrichia bacterium]
MIEVYNYLSGNVPGGLALYILLVLLIFTVLNSISKKNDLFTPERSRQFFFWIWILMTAGYMFWWMSNPPEGKMYRYAVIVQPNESDEELNWLSNYLQEAFSEGMTPFRDRNEVNFRQRWAGTGGMKVAPQHAFWDSLMNRLPAYTYAFISVDRQNGKPMLSIKRYDDGEAKPTAETVLELNSVDPRGAIKSVENLLGEPFIARKQANLPNPAIRELTKVRHLFYLGDYAASGKLAAKLFNKMPQDPEVQKWHYYNEIKRAGTLKEGQEATRTNELDQRKLPWQRLLHNSRAVLIRMVQENLKDDIDDDYLIAMTAESFMLDEYYADAEEFLEIGHGVNPLSLDILLPLSRLHYTRYRDLGFANETAILRRILEISPFHESTLERFAENLLPRVNLETATGEELRDRLLKALRLNPESSRTWVLQGKFDNAIQNYDGALYAFNKADSLSPGDGVLKYNHGVALFRLERFDEAADYFTEAVKLNDYLDAHLYLGAIYEQRGEYEKALERFRYRVANKGGEEDVYVREAMQGIRNCLEKLNISIPGT